MFVPKNILNYRIIIDTETDQKSGKTVYTAYSPTLGVADWGKTKEKAVENIHEAIVCHIQSLVKHNNPVPKPDSPEFIISNASIELPSEIHLKFL